MASVRKRTWVSGGKEKTAWLVAYRDSLKARRFETFPTERQANARKKQIEHELDQGIHTPNSTSLTVAEAAELWLQHCAAEGLERATIVSNRNNVEKHIVPLIGDYKLSELNAPLIERYRDRLLQQPNAKSPSQKITRLTAKRVLTSLKTLLNEAMRRGLVSRNAASTVSINMKARDKRRLAIGIDIFTKEEVRRLIATAQGLTTTQNRWHALLVTAALTGMRASELRGLPWDAVDFDAKAIHVRQRLDNFLDLGSVKSEAGDRKIPMAPPVLNALREWRLACPKGPMDLVFPTGTGKGEHHANIIRAFESIQVKARIIDKAGKAKYHFHSLRHFAASWMIEQNFAPKRLQSLMGHSSIQVTFDIYGHLFPSLEDDHAKFAAGSLAIVGN